MLACIASALATVACNAPSGDKPKPEKDAGVSVAKKEPIAVALVAAMSGGSALSGEAIKRGLQVAIEEVNASGGLLGRQVTLVIRDDEGNAAKGVAAVREVVEREKAVAIFGGLHSPVALAEVPVIQELKVPYLGVWAAGTNIVKNGHNPNYVFRVSANDDAVDGFLVSHASKIGCQKLGVMRENTPWGDSNEEGLKRWSAVAKRKIVGVEKFNWGDSDMTAQLLRLRKSGAGCMVLIANAPEGAQVVKSAAKLGWSVPTLSHWGISGGRFAELTGNLGEAVTFVQTYSFFGNQSEVGARLLAALQRRYGVKGPADVVAPVGTANAFDAMHVLAQAIRDAKETTGPALQRALENVKEVKGLIKTYRPPFTADDHEALDEKDYILVRWKGGSIVPFDGGATPAGSGAPSTTPARREGDASP